MKLTILLPVVALSTALVIPDEQVMNQIAIESHQTSKSVFDKLPTKGELHDCVEDVFTSGPKVRVVGGFLTFPSSY